MVTLSQLRTALMASWSAETSFVPNEWSPQNPARGQCVVTALVVQRYLGGELKKLDTIFEDHEESHYYNILPDGTEVDMTGGQYPANQVLTPSEVNLHGYTTVRDKMLHEPVTRHNYELLLSRVERLLPQ